MPIEAKRNVCMLDSLVRFQACCPRQPAGLRRRQPLRLPYQPSHRCTGLTDVYARRLYLVCVERAPILD